MPGGGFLPAQLQETRLVQETWAAGIARARGHAISNVQENKTYFKEAAVALLQEARVVRIARGSGHAVNEVLALLEEHRRLAKMFQGAHTPICLRMVSSPKNSMWLRCTQALLQRHLRCRRAAPGTVHNSEGGIAGAVAFVSHSHDRRRQSSAASHECNTGS